MVTLMERITVRIAEELGRAEVEAEAEREAKWHKFVEQTEPIEDKFKPVLRTAFTKQEKSVIAKLRRTPVPSIKATKTTPCIGDKVQYRNGIGTITDIFLATDFIHRRLMLEINTERNYSTNVFLCDVVLLKGSDEAEAASEIYVDAIYTASAWQTVFETAALPFVTEAYKLAGQEAFTEIGFQAAFNVTNPRARKYLEEKVVKFAEEVNEVTREKIRKALVKGLDAGEGIPQISQRIADVFEINRGSRTDKIARTEIVGASNNGTYHGYVESEIVETHTWIDSRDERVRTTPHNHRLDGEEVKLGERFSNGLLHPHDPGGAAGNVINCRCTLAASELKET